MAAARQATEYKRIEFDLNSLQLNRFMQMFQMKGFRTKTRIYENGDSEDIEFILIDQNKECPLVFRHLGTSLKFEGSYRITDWKLAQIMQKAVRDFNANALVHRIYDSYTIEYSYKYGKVTQIRELRPESNNPLIIYKYHDPLSELQHIFSQQTIELEIDKVKQQIDMLLDERNLLRNGDKAPIDQKLKVLSNKLFMLEG